jgi:hypothetical protein
MLLEVDLDNLELSRIDPRRDVTRRDAIFTSGRSRPGAALFFLPH